MAYDWGEIYGKSMAIYGNIWKMMAIILLFSLENDGNNIWKMMENNGNDGNNISPLCLGLPEVFFSRPLGLGAPDLQLHAAGGSRSVRRPGRW